MLKLLLFVVVMTVGQLLFKRSADALAGVEGTSELIRRLAIDPGFLAALTLYAFATFLWVAALREIPLSRAYPFTALAFTLVPVGAALFFGETLGPRYLLGLALVLAGIFLISQPSTPTARAPVAES
jgi:drug/metabolite transporter (DMT)-like permease